VVEKIRAVVVDTYALIADLTGQITPTAARVLDYVRIGRVEGVIHYLIIYELSYHWMRGRLPFRNEEELLEFIETYFRVASIDSELALEASRIKLAGDRMLRDASVEKLRRRKLSASDCTTIALARRLRVPIVTGDSDLVYVAERMGIEVIW